MFYGVTRCQKGKVLNNDAFLTVGNMAFVMDGVGETLGVTGDVKYHLGQVIKGRKQEAEDIGIHDVLRFAHSGMLGTGCRATFVGVELFKDRLRMISVGDSSAWIYRGYSGKLEKINSSTNGKLGGDIAATWDGFFDIKRGDVIVLASDGYQVDNYRTMRQIQKFILRPAELPHALMELQMDRSDDCTIVTKVF